MSAFDHIYRLIDSILVSGDSAEVRLCCKILKHNLKYASYDNVYAIYEHYSSIVSGLMLQASKASEDPIIE